MVWYLIMKKILYDFIYLSITNKDNIFKIGYALAPPAPGYSIWKAETLYSTSLDAGFFYYTNVNNLVFS